MDPLLAFDLGGTRIKAGLASASTAVVERLVTVPTPPTALGALEQLRQLGKALLQGRTCGGVGLCVPGLVEPPGTVAALPGKLPGLVGLDLGAFLEESFHLSPVVANDAVAYAVGEALGGAGRGFHRVVVVTLGTGVGVGVVQQGSPLSDGRLGGGVLGGHLPISDLEPKLQDSAGREGTIEALCAARRLVDYAAKEGFAYDCVEAVYRGHEAKEPAALLGVARFRRHLLRALVALAHAHCPDAVVLGGGPLAPGNPLLPGLEEALAARLFEGLRVRVLPAALGDGAALVGLAHLHQRRYGPGA